MGAGSSIGAEVTIAAADVLTSWGVGAALAASVVESVVGVVSDVTKVVGAVAEFFVVVEVVELTPGVGLFAELSDCAVVTAGVVAGVVLVVLGCSAAKVAEQTVTSVNENNLCCNFIICAT